MLRRIKHVSLELTDQEVRILGYIPSKKMTLVMYETIPLSTGVIEQGMVCQPTELTAVLREWVTNQAIQGKVNARVAIPLSNGFVRKYSLPWASKRDRKRLIHYLADEEIPIPEDDRVFDHWITPEKTQEKSLQVVLSGIRKVRLDSFTRCLETAGFRIESIGFTPLAWAYALQIKPQEQVLLIKEQSDVYQISFYHGIIPEIVRLLRHDRQGSQGNELWDTELERILSYLLTSRENLDIQRVIINPSEESVSLGTKVCAFLQREKGISPQLQTLDKVFISALSFFKEEPRKILAVWGMALQHNLEHPNNFWRERTRVQRQQRRMGIVACLFLALSLAGIDLKDQLVQQVEKLDQEVSQLGVKGELETQAAQEEIRRTEEWLHLMEQPGTVGRDLAQLQSLVGEEIEFEQLEHKEGTVMIQGKATNPVSVQDLFNQLQQLGWQEPRLGTYQLEGNQDTGSVIEFTLTTKR